VNRPVGRRSRQGAVDIRCRDHPAAVEPCPPRSTARWASPTPPHAS